MKYAQATEVPVAKSKMEIELTLQKYGAKSFISGWQGDRAMIAFEMQERSIRFVLPMPSQTAEEFMFTVDRWKNKKRRSDTQIAEAWEQACRQRWRALALCIKAKLEAVECGIVSFDQEFLAHFQMPDGRTIGEHIIPQLAGKELPRLNL